jgi:hypothetical protein
MFFFTIGGTPFGLGLSNMSFIMERAYTFMIEDTSSTIEEDLNLFLLDVAN